MSINLKQLEKFGITIDYLQKPPVAHVPKGLSHSTYHDLWLSFDGNVKLNITEGGSDVEQSRA
ncbi:hypothetical protein N9E07_09335, partial [Planktomarina temperata]|nr:hypothetical protein [Planktomarina temperata]